MSDVLVRVSGSCGRITLNRPRALNALTLEMVNIMHAALMTWAHDVSIQFVLVDGAGERGLCAGGDSLRRGVLRWKSILKDLSTDHRRYTEHLAAHKLKRNSCVV